ncbi:hypothetical protein [Natrinema sp. DC36]|nr:hypothetical protein [Natrinema sp. DC36]
MQIVDGNLTTIHGATLWVRPLITVRRVGNRIVDTMSSVKLRDVL